MYNYFMLIGRICNDIEIKYTSTGKKVINLILAVKRPFKNSEGVYETDFFKVSLWEYIAEISHELLQKGVTVGIKGRLVIGTINQDTESNITSTELVGERVMLLSSSKKEPMIT